MDAVAAAMTFVMSNIDLESLVIYRAEGDPSKKKFITDNRLHDICVSA